MIFVFGSNLMGVHGKGAALHARKFFGAIMGQGEGRQGNSYGIPTKYSPYVGLDLPIIEEGVDRFLLYARKNPEERFYLTAIGTGYAGRTHGDIAPMFRGLPDNVQPPIEWLEYLFEEFS